MVRAPRGTKDLLPGEIEKWQYLEKLARELCKIYGYQEIRTPIFEHTELFLRGIGEETDIVQKEMYTFTDRGGRSITLRPEGTAPVVRAYLEHRLDAQPQPVKLYYLGPMFRYDRPQAGRFRQFHQFGFEVFGSHDPAVDAEVISLAWDFLSRLGLSGLQVELNSVGCPACRPSFAESLRTFFGMHRDSLCSFCQARLERNPLRLLDCKIPGCREVGRDAPLLLDYLCDDCCAHFSKLQDLLGVLNIPFQVNARLVRGLDYYTRTVFEVSLEALGAQSSLAGGGRYNNLVEACGGEPTPGIGVALGLERVLLALEKLGVGLPLEAPELVFVAAVGETNFQQLNREALRLVAELRRAGYAADKDYLGRSLKAQMKFAGKIGARYVIIMGEKELREGNFILRDMKEGTQFLLRREGIFEFLEDLRNGEEGKWKASEN
ncbi:MAG: histidine--tRNA ligase [Firmicutes bacterium]|nr:histidine--tRNA ligase [Bacillota bacterium]